MRSVPLGPVLARLAGLAGLALVAAGAPGLALGQTVPSVEVAGSGNDTTTTTPTLGPVTATMRVNADNPGANSFSAIAGAATQPAVAIQVTRLNPQFATSGNLVNNALYIGASDLANGNQRIETLDVRGGTNSQFTSLPVVADGTGIDIATNRGFMMGIPTRALAAGRAPRTDRIWVGDITLTPNMPMSNVVLHLAGLGGYEQGEKSFSAEFTLVPGDGATGLGRLSGNSALVVSGNQINHGLSAPGGYCDAARLGACGSVQVLGASIRKITLQVFIRSSDSFAWPTESANGDAFLVSLSGEVAEPSVRFAGALPGPIYAGETYRGLTASCTNNGPNTARNATCGVGVTTGAISNLSCAGLVSGALGSGATATCSFDYTAPMHGTALPGTVTFTATTGADNDRDASTASNLASSAAIGLQGSAFKPSAPSATCRPAADRVSFSFPSAGSNEAVSYDLTSHSPFSYDTNGKPMFMVGNGTVQSWSPSSDLAPGQVFRPVELTTAALPATGANASGEIVIITSRVVGRPGSAMTVKVSDSGDVDHDVATIETASGGMIARTPLAGSDSSNADFTLSFTMPSEGYVFLRQYIADYEANYGFRLDGGCLRTDLVTSKAATTAAVEGGQAASFTIRVRNNGPSDASNVQLTDLMPSALSGITAASSAGTYDPASGLWTLGNLASGASATLTLTGTAPRVTADTVVTNTTSGASGDQIDPATAGDVLSASVTVLRAAQVNATKAVRLLSNQAANCGARSSTADAGVAAFIPGSCVEYVITLSNPTGSVARDIAMTDVLAGGLTFMAATAASFDTSDPAYALTAPPSGTTCGGTACTIRLSKARLAGGGSGTVRIRAVLQ